MLDQLPPEIIDQVFANLEPIDVAQCFSASRLLQNHASRDSLWQRFVHERLGIALTSPYPYSTWDEFYKRHHLHMFLARQKLWISDNPDYGRLLIALFDPRRGCIEAYQLVARTNSLPLSRYLNWGEDGGTVLTRTFNPTFSLNRNSPFLRISPEDYMSADEQFGRSLSVGGSKLVPEVRISNSRESTAMDGYMSHFLFTRNLPQSQCTPQTNLWPPLCLPSPSNARTRCLSHNDYRSSGHHPNKLSEVSEASFRIRRSMIYRTLAPMHHHQQQMHYPDRTETFGTISPEAYTPTEQKPWQGIWVGDYSGHDCEFLLITQPDAADALPLPEKCRSAFANWPRSTPWQALIRGATPPEDEPAESSDAEDVGVQGPVAPTNLTAALQAQQRRESTGEVPPIESRGSPQMEISDDEAPYRGRLEALKLTGDPNVPRGEITFVAEDLGARGLAGYTKDQDFVDPAILAKLPPGQGPDMGLPGWPGTRMVKSCGHVADNSPRRDSYIPSQLVLVSPDILAQWWMPYRYVVFYRRVNIEQYTSC